MRREFHFEGDELEDVELDAELEYGDELDDELDDEQEEAFQRAAAIILAEIAKALKRRTR